MGKWLGKDLEQATAEDVREFALYRLNECKLGGSSMRILISGLRHFYTVVLEREWPILEQMGVREQRTLPIVLNRQEVWRILEHAPDICHRTYLLTVYSCGLRLSKALNLTVHDINGDRMCLHVRHGKGGKDRIVPLPMGTYRQLRRYWATHRNPELIFPALGRGSKKGPTATKPMPTHTVQGGLKRAVKAAGNTRRGIRIHTLRHCYATHLLEANVNVHAIQGMLGHTSLVTTLRYFHLTDLGAQDVKEIIEQLMSPPTSNTNKRDNGQEVDNG